MEQRPAAVLALDVAEIHRDLALQLGLDAVEEVAQQHELGGDGGVGLQFEHPVPVRRAAAKQRRTGARYGLGGAFVRQGVDECVAGHRSVRALQLIAAPAPPFART